jgi:hypothetical protein
MLDSHRRRALAVLVATLSVIASAPCRCAAVPALQRPASAHACCPRGSGAPDRRQSTDTQTGDRHHACAHCVLLGRSDDISSSSLARTVLSPPSLLAGAVPFSSVRVASTQYLPHHRPPPRVSGTRRFVVLKSLLL